MLHITSHTSHSQTRHFQSLLQKFAHRTIPLRVSLFALTLSVIVNILCVFRVQPTHVSQGSLYQNLPGGVTGSRAGSRRRVPPGPSIFGASPPLSSPLSGFGARCSVRRVVCLAHETRFPSSLIFGTDGCNYRGSGMILFHRNSNCKFN